MPGQERRRLIIHERLGAWARQLRPRLSDQVVRVVETRTAQDLEAALRGPGSAYSLVVLDVGRRPSTALEHLERAAALSPDALILALDAAGHAGLPALARELGAAHVLTGPVPPPVVAALLGRWIALARRRAEAAGWMGVPPPSTESDAWKWLSPLLQDGS